MYSEMFFHKKGKEGKRNFILYSYVHRLMASEGTQKTRDGAWSLDFCLSICMEKHRSPLVHKYFKEDPLKRALCSYCHEILKKSVVVLSFFGSSWQNLLQSKDAFQRSQRYHVSNGLCCHHPWLFSSTLLQRWPDARFGAIMQVSSLLVSHFELLFYFLKGQSHISCPRCKITSDM